MYSRANGQSDPENRQELGYLHGFLMYVHTMDVYCYMYRPLRDLGDAKVSLQSGERHRMAFLFDRSDKAARRQIVNR